MNRNAPSCCRQRSSTRSARLVSIKSRSIPASRACFSNSLSSTMPSRKPDRHRPQRETSAFAKSARLDENGRLERLRLSTGAGTRFSRAEIFGRARQVYPRLGKMTSCPQFGFYPGKSRGSLRPRPFRTDFSQRQSATPRFPLGQVHWVRLSIVLPTWQTRHTLINLWKLSP